MTADDIIAANPEYQFQRTRLYNREALVGTRPDGPDCWIIWKGEHMVCTSGPWTPEMWKAALANLEGAQPGREFNTKGADAYARAMRQAGFTVVKDEDGEPHSLWKT